MYVAPLIFIIESVMDDCKDENDFMQFVYAVQGDEGWNWISNRPGLRNSALMPSIPLGRIRLSSDQAEFLVHKARVEKKWSLASLYQEGKTLSAHGEHAMGLRIARGEFFSNLVESLSTDIDGKRFLAKNPAHGQLMSADHEAGITVTAVERAVDPAWILSGEVSANWRQQASAQRVLSYLDIDPNASPQQRLSVMTLKEAQSDLSEIVGDSGGCCLVGVMVADIRMAYGQIFRIVSFSGNMCGKSGEYKPHISQGQGSQIHMEIFHLERLGALLDYLQTRPEPIISSVNVGVLGLKTSKVVSENKMCIACDSTRKKKLDDHPLLKGVRVNFDPLFLGP